MKSSHKFWPFIQNHKNALILILVVFSTLNLFSQRLHDSRLSSYYSYIYRISDEEAERIYRNSASVIDQSYFHTLIDSCLSDSILVPSLQPGHYIKTRAYKNQQECFLISVSDLNVYILNNETDLSIQIYDKQGEIIKDAEVRLGWKNLKFNHETNFYTDKHSNRKGLLKIIWGGLSTFYEIDRRYDQSGFSYSTRKLVYGSPLRYVWIPVYTVIRLPYDGVKSIVRHYPSGSVYALNNFFTNVGQKIACLFDNFYCQEQPNKNSYLVFNQPKYRPGDTVKFKAIVLNERGKPIDKNLQVLLTNAGKNIKINSSLKPYRKGGYAYQFVLDDSLKLKLDKEYYLSLENNRLKCFAEGSFRYEDYELGKTTLEVRTDNETHYKSQDLKLYIRGTDENDLSLLDARAEILIVAKDVKECFLNQVFVSDTLLFLKKNLEPSGETEIIISDSTFPEANFEYRILTRMLTTDNEVLSQTIDVNYYHRIKKFEFELVGDSIAFSLVENGIPVFEPAIIKANDKNGHDVEVYNGTSQGKIKIDPLYHTYRAKAEDVIGTFNLMTVEPELQCFAERSYDSLLIVIDNPHKIPFNYEIFKKNRNKEKGFINSLNYHSKVISKKNYYISLGYIWAGQVKEENYKIPLRDKNLKIEVAQPKVVFPGQKATIQVSVRDQHNKPVEGVDLTAYSIKKKFNYTPPVIPYIGKERKAKKIVNSFSFGDYKSIETNLELDFEAWKLFASLDSIEYYRFVYPGNTIYRFEYSTTDSLTQFAPFVVNNGKPEQIHVIHLDGKPVYFSWTTTKPPYSFTADSGYHQITLRTRTRNIIIDSIYFTKGEKLIFSLDQQSSNKHIRIEEAKPELTAKEQGQLYPYIVPYKNTFKQLTKMAYLEQKDNYQILDGASYTNFAGPFSGLVKFNILDGYSVEFVHEPMFEYEFGYQLLKQKSLDIKMYPRELNYFTDQASSLYDVVLTKEAIKEKWQEKADSRRMETARYYNPTSTRSGNGKLMIDYNISNHPHIDLPLNLILFKVTDKDFIRVYPGKTRTMHDLDPGTYKLIIFFAGSRYHSEELILIKPNTSTYLNITFPSELKKDYFSIEVSNLISNTIYSSFTKTNDPIRELSEIKHLYHNENQFSGPSRLIEGYVYDHLTDEPIPFVNVMISGTDYGTVTDFNGFYSLKVPLNKDILVFSFVGYNVAHKRISVDNMQNVRLESDFNALEGIVVTAMAISKTKKSVTSAATSVGGVLSNPFANDYYDKEDASKITNTAKLPDYEDFDQVFYETVRDSGNVRNNFSDYAFWQPSLTTNKEGIASFKVTFPGDITKWQTHYLAMNDKKQSGQANLSIRSLKPLMAQLAIPRFLVSGDTAVVIGKSLNYMPDTSYIITSFEINGKALTSTNHKCIHSIIDSTIIIPTDSLSISYTLSKSDGYNDGEVRNIPVYPVGLEESKGNFFNLNKDTTFSISFNPDLGKVHFYARADYLEVVEDEINYLLYYRYGCNEQLASKIKALLSLHQISQYRGENFKKEREINKLIKLLLKNQNEYGLWGWWKDGEQSDWISLHVLEALTKASSLDYTVNLNKEDITKTLVWLFGVSDDFYYKARTLRTMLLLDSKVNYNSMINSLELVKTNELTCILELIDLRKRCGLKYDIRKMLPYQRTTLFGNIYYSGKETKNNLLQNEIQNTLIAYIILRSDSLSHAETLIKIRNYFLEMRNSGFWGNTYESAKIIETILPDLLEKDGKEVKPVMILRGTYKDTITKFPYEKVISPNDTLTISKTGNYPVYLTAWQRDWNPQPVVKKGKMEIATRFAENPGYYLKAGQETTLVAEVTLHENAEYVMINIPIPGSCSYADKKQKNYYESHREYYKNETAIFCERLSKGTYKFEVKLLPRYTGTYTLNPAKIELMYFPVINANNEVKKVKVGTIAPEI